MGLESASYLDDLDSANPTSGDPRSEGDDHFRQIKAVLKSTFPGLVGRAWRTQSKSGAYTPVASDNMTVLDCTAALTLSLTAAATLGNGWMCMVRANGGAVTIDPNGAELIDGATTLVIPDGTGALIICDGTSFVAIATSYSFPSGTKMLFQQATPPSGWTIDTTHNDKALRVVSSAPGSGGAVAFSSIFGSAVSSTDGHSITQAELPNCSFSESSAHAHSGTTGTESADHTHAQNVSDGDFGSQVPAYLYSSGGTSKSTGSGPGNVTYGRVTTDGRSATHTHAFTTSGTTVSVQSGGSDTAHTHTLSLDLEYVDIIIATKN